MKIIQRSSINVSLIKGCFYLVCEFFPVQVLLKISFLNYALHISTVLINELPVGEVQICSHTVWFAAAAKQD